MQLEMIETLENENVKCSLYFNPGRKDHMLWLKVGVALLQIPEAMLQDVIDALRHIQTTIEDREGGSNG